MYFKLIAGMIITYLALQDSDNPNMTTTTNSSAFFAPPLDDLTLRNDNAGQGHFGASRKKKVNGKIVRYKHNGTDYTAYKYQPVYSPITGQITRIAQPYSFDSRWKGCEIIGTGNYAAYAVKMFYMIPAIVPLYVIAGQEIGLMQDISEKWGKGMTPHLHIEVRKNGVLIDPAILFLNNQIV